MHHRLSGLLCGLGGGAVGVLVMNKVMKRTSGLVKRRTGDHHPREHDMSAFGRKHASDESATDALGRRVYRAATGHEPAPETKQSLGTAVHWGYGVAMGGAYGLVRSRRRGADIAAGMLFGAGLWALGDELAIPLLGLAEGPKAHPPLEHVQALGGHIAYGATAAAATQVLRRFIR